MALIESPEPTAGAVGVGKAMPGLSRWESHAFPGGQAKGREWKRGCFSVGNRVPLPGEKQPSPNLLTITTDIRCSEEGSKTGD